MQWPLIQKQERKMVVYQALYGDYQVYVRPLEMFISPVDREKYPDVEQEYRFEQVFPGQMNELGKNGNKPATGNLAGYDQTQQPEEPMSHEWLERFWTLTARKISWLY